MLAAVAAGISGAVGLAYPVWGIVLFLVANTGAEGFLRAMGLTDTVLGPFQPAATAYMGAVVSILVRRRRTTGPRVMGATLFLLWALTVLMVVSRVVELQAVDTRIIWELVQAGLWAPLYVALGKMSSHETQVCERAMIMTSAFTALLALVISLSGSYWLRDLLADRSEELTQTGFMAGRIIVPGLWSFMPFGLWVALRQIYHADRLMRGWTLVYTSSALVMLLAVAFNLTRSILLGVLTGALLVASGLLKLKGHRDARAFVMVVLIAGGLSVAVLSPILSRGWMGRVEETEQGGSAEGRIIRNQYVFRSLVEQMPVFGAKDYWSSEFQISGVIGDQHTVLTQWANYGTIAGAVFVVLLILPLAKIVSVIRSNRLPTVERVDALFLLAYYIQFQWYMLAGNYFFEVAAFAFVFLLSQVRRRAVAQRVAMNE